MPGFTSLTGSSPLARGAQEWGFRYVSNIGIIPARAGSTAPGEGTHPSGGSSPLARGALDPNVEAELLARIIPARAGSTPWP